MLALWLPSCIYDRLQNGKPGECIWEPSLNKEFVIVVATLGHHGACAIIVFCYSKVLVFMFRLNKKKSMRAGPTDRRTVSAVIVETTQGLGDPSTVVAETTPYLCEPSVLVGEAAYGLCSPSSVFDKRTHDLGESPNDDTSRSDIKQNSRTGIKKPKLQSQRRERRAFITMTYVIIGYAVCWIPFHVVFDVISFCPSCVPRGVYAVTFWMTYINSTINPFIYNFSTPEFRRTFRRLLCRC